MGLEEIRKLKHEAGLPKPPKQHIIAKKSAKKLKQEADEKERLGGNDTERVKWYKMQMKYMNVCEETGLRLETKIYRYAIMSICHILPKSTCPSVAEHPLNRMFFIPDFHTKFDAMSWEEREKLGCWPVIRDRLIMVFPDLAVEERRHFPDSVLKFIENNQPF
jgi:hypothetical protein